MKATGIVRRIDELGRVVIPKEIRRTLRIREGDPLEIFTERDGGIILRKYSPIGELTSYAKEFTDSLYKSLGTTSVICDKDAVIAASGSQKKDYMDNSVSPELENIMDKRRVYIYNGAEGSGIPIVSGENTTDVKGQVVAPIISQGQPVGAVAVISKKEEISAAEIKVAETTAFFLGMQMEQ